MNQKALSSILAVVYAAFQAAPPGLAQAAAQPGSQSGGGQATTGPSGGLSAGSAPIETTLFAYRALQSDAEAIAGKIREAHTGDRIVIGGQPDIAALLEWRTVLGQADLLQSQLAAMHYALARLNGSYRRATPLASLSVTKTHQGTLAKGGTGTYTVVVSNSPAASATVGTVLVTDTPQDGVNIVSMAGNGWTCSLLAAGGPRNTCTRNDALSPGAVYDPITVKVNIPSNAGENVTNTVTVAGGGSATASATDTSALSSGSAAPRAGEHALLIAPLGAGAAGGTGSANASATPPASPFSTALSAIPTLTALAQFIATSFAVNQTLSPWQGSMTDMPLINATAGILRRSGHDVFIPATYPPLALTGKDLTTTYFWKKLTELRDARVTIWDDVAMANSLLMDANFVTQNPTKYAASNLNDALEYAGKAQSLLTSAQTLTAGADAFVANLFGAQVSGGGAAAAPGGAGASAPTGNAPATSGAAPSNSAASSPTQTPVPATAPSAAGAGTPTSASAPSPAGSGAQNAAGSTGTPAQAAIPLQQIIAADFLAQRIFNYKPDLDANDLNSINFLSLHALESGGSELVKSNLFYGTRIFFSGGSVATFSLYRLPGELQCSGTAFDYTGNVREKDVERRVLNPDVPRARIRDFSCLDMKDTAERRPVREGMTRTEVEAAFGKPDKAFQRNSLYLYRSRNTVVEFRRGMVYRIMAAETTRQESARLQ